MKIEREREMEKKEKGHEDRQVERERWRRKIRDMKIDTQREREREMEKKKKGHEDRQRERERDGEEGKGT